jgi:penicillin-binding protein 1A
MMPMRRGRLAQGARTIANSWRDLSPRGRRLLAIGVPLSLALFLGGLAGVGAGALIQMPRVDSIADFQPALITQLFDAEGERFATFSRERRILLSDEDLPELIRQAVLASEDSNFFEHGGVDPIGILRAVVKNIVEGRRGDRVVGGSTITQQLARRLFLTPGKTWRRKIEEALLAVELEKNFSKDQILTLYCNLMYFNHGNYGVEAAARSYFDIPAAELTVPQAAMLAGILQRPSSYSPYSRAELVRGRRDYVLRRMLEDGYISTAQYEDARSQPLGVVPRRRESQSAAYFAEEIRRDLENRYGSDALLEQGLQVATTLSTPIQKAARAALRDGLVRIDHGQGWRGPISRLAEDEDPETHQLDSSSRLVDETGDWLQGIVLGAGRTARVRIGDEIHDLSPAGFAWTRHERASRLVGRGDVAWFRWQPAEKEDQPPTLMLEQEPELEGALVVLESATGAVRAMVGGWSFERSKFNRVTQARRQVGSAFKPFVAGAALESGFTPADTLFDAPTVFAGANNIFNYSPRNYYPRYYGITTLRRALELSINVTAVKLFDLVGADQVVGFARRCGVSSALPPYPSLALGAASLTPLELAASYATIANQGLHVEPYLVERVSDGTGRTLEQHGPRAYKAMEPQTAYLLTTMLEGVVDRGTARAAAKLPLALAGKTGTTDDYTDAWFAGFTPRYTALVWIGHDRNRRIGRNMTGAEAALPIWQQLIEAGLEAGWLERGEGFTMPPDIVEMPVEYLSGLATAPGAKTVIVESFVRGTEPARQYEPRWGEILALPWYQQRLFYLAKAGENMPEDVADWEIVREAWEASDEDEDEG